MRVCSYYITRCQWGMKGTAQNDRSRTFIKFTLLYFYWFTYLFDSLVSVPFSHITFDFTFCSQPHCPEQCDSTRQQLDSCGHTRVNSCIISLGNFYARYNSYRAVIQPNIGLAGQRGHRRIFHSYYVRRFDSMMPHYQQHKNRGFIRRFKKAIILIYCSFKYISLKNAGTP